MAVELAALLEGGAVAGQRLLDALALVETGRVEGPVLLAVGVAHVAARVAAAVAGAVAAAARHRRRLRRRRRVPSARSSTGNNNDQ